ncbi:MAG: cadherin-like beta sandwich domain-containing protein, partial [Clostridia bacterium]|nr:cadherin-like beta sandwich domain-containing protein [Clostridia bacterium]
MCLFGTTNIKLFGEPEVETSEVSGTGYVSLVPGKNTAYINVKAENGAVRTYEVVINREKSINNNLIELIPSVGTLEPSFSYGNTEYNLTLGNADSLLSFEVSTEDRFAVVTGNEEQVVPDGLSTRIITVTAEDGTKKEYTVNVNRIRTDDARLKSLQVKSFEIEEEFNSDLYEYT